MTKKKEKYEVITADLYEEDERRVSIGNPVLDKITGGGVPIGKVVELYGDWSTGKTVLAWTILREAQKMGGYTLLIEAEDAFNKEFASTCGLDLDKLRIIRSTKEYPLTCPIFFTAVAKEMRKANRNYPFSVIALDSLAALNPAAEAADGDEAFDKHYMGTLAREMSKGLRLLKPQLHPYNSTLVIVNQVRDNIGVMFGNKETTPGGRAVKFFSDLRLLLARPKKERKAKEDVGILATFYVAKNKIAPPFKSSKFRILWDIGLDPSYGVEEDVPEGNVEENEEDTG